MTTHTKDVGLAIRDALDLLDGVIERHDWAAEEPGLIVDDEGVEITTDASHGFDNLLVSTSDGALFRVTITREG